MLRVFKLGFAEFTVTDMDAMANYYTRVMGFRETERGDDGTRYISIGFDHHNIALKPAAESGLRVVGWQLDGGMSLEEVAKELAGHGIRSEIKTDARPGVARLLELRDTDGNILQLYNEMEATVPGFAASGVAPVKLGHIAICSPDAKKLAAFYRDVLHFWETDWIGPIANFLTCNKDHHTVNCAQAERSAMHHIAFELRDFAQHRESADILARNGIRTVWGPSRHTAGHNVAAYHEDPEGRIVELYSDMDVYIPELNCMEPRPWHEDLPQRPKVWDGPIAWGTRIDYDFSAVGRKRG